MSGINALIKGLILFAITYIVAIVVFIYIGYFTGMVVSLTAGWLLGIEPALLAEIFAWIGAGFAKLLLFLAIIFTQVDKRNSGAIEINDDDFNELFSELFDKGSD